ncbi:hypothetical protein ACF0H5_001153 [Mactra antiquata]
MIPKSTISAFFLAAIEIVTCETKGDNHVDPTSRYTESSFPVIDHYMPSKQDLKVKKLLRRLGEDLDPEWMSVEKIKKSYSKYSSENNEYSREKPENTDNVLGIDMESDWGNSTRHTLMLDLQEKMCGTKFSWKKMDPLFWPKYIKQGHCIERKQCSIHPDMLCRMGETKTVKALHWSCKKQKPGNKKRNGKTKPNHIRDNRLLEYTKADLRSNLKCRWKKVNVNVKTKCVCSCT